MIESLLYTRPDFSSTTLQCGLCPHFCFIKNGKTGICKTRKNIDGTLYALNYGKLIAARPDPVEKKPLYHFHPNHSSFSISSTGCNFACKNCQNSSISQQDISSLDIHTTSPQDVVDEALQHQCKSISYTYTEPTTLLEFILDTSKIASSHGLQNILVSNGFMSDQCIDYLVPSIQAINIDLKSFSDEFYKKICHARLQPVLNTISRMHEAGIHVELTTLIIPGLNDHDEEFRKISRFIYDLHPDIPWHISRFHPSYKLPDTAITPLETLLKARDIGHELGLNHIYVGNAPEVQSNTICPECKTLLIERSGYSVTLQDFKKGHCLKCDRQLFGHF